MNIKEDANRTYGNSPRNGRYENRAFENQANARRPEPSRSDHREPPAWVASARNCFSGRLLTDAQFEEVIAITSIIAREIRRSGAFKDKLGDYAYAFSRLEKFDAAKAETIIRDLFKERFGVTMNQMRENLIEREQRITDEEKRAGYEHAMAAGRLVENGPMMPFYRAFCQEAQAFAATLGVTDAFAKAVIAAEFKAAERTELSDWGKELEDRFFRPQIEAEKKKRNGSEAESRSGEHRRRSGPNSP